MLYEEIENVLNQFDDWEIGGKSDDGRRNSQDAEEGICEKINKRIEVNKFKTHNRESFDLYMLSDGEDLKIVEPDNFTNTISFTKLAKMLGLKGNSTSTICKSYREKKEKGDIRLVNDYVCVYLNKQTKKFTICSLTELPIECVTVNPSNCIQTKIPNSKVIRSNEEKFKFVHDLFITYINKRILIPAKEWGEVING